MSTRLRPGRVEADRGRSLADSSFRRLRLDPGDEAIFPQERADFFAAVVKRIGRDDHSRWLEPLTWSSGMRDEEARAEDRRSPLFPASPPPEGADSSSAPLVVTEGALPSEPRSGITPEVRAGPSGGQLDDGPRGREADAQAEARLPSDSRSQSHRLVRRRHSRGMRSRDNRCPTTPRRANRLARGG